MTWWKSLKDCGATMYFTFDFMELQKSDYVFPTVQSPTLMSLIMKNTVQKHVKTAKTSFLLKWLFKVMYVLNAYLEIYSVLF